MKRNKPTKFDLDRLLEASVAAISTFATAHRSETFYAFAIDANMLCLNSEEKFAKSLREYQSKYPEDYTTNEAISLLKMNTGDWSYQGFCDLEEEHGFCPDLYDEHYDTNAIQTTTTEYSRQMTELVKRIEKNGVLKQLKQTADFVAFVAEHNY